VSVENEYILVSYVLFMVVVYVLIVSTWCWSWFHLCHHVKGDGVVVACVCHECISITHWLCRLMLISCYAYIYMVIAIVHETMVCGWRGHAS